MGFNEKVHAYIAAKYYVYLTEAFGERGKAAFIHATQYYAGQRGRRMAQRAIRDGQNLDSFTTYWRYGEWVNTEEVKAAGCSNLMAYETYQPTADLLITRCPWHSQFQEMGLDQTAGMEYCRHLDAAIARGFNPYLDYTVEQTMYTAPACLHRMKNSDFNAETSLAKKPENLRDFTYHCAHSYWAYAEVTSAIFKDAGEEINRKVLADVAADYSQDMADTLLSYSSTNFNVCD